MKPCRSYQPQLAQLALGELNETERAGVLEHLGHCPGCRDYANQLDKIAGLYAQDAQRSVAIPAVTTRRRERPRISWLPKPALATFGLFIIAALILFFRPGAEPPQTLPAAPAAGVARPLSVASSRHLAEKDLEELVQSDRSNMSAHRESLFSVRSRNGGDL